MTEGSRARRALVKTAYGAIVGGIAIACLIIGPATLFAFLLVLAVVAAGEMFHLARSRGLRPVPLVGFAGVIALLSVAYARGARAPAWFPAVLAAVVGSALLAFMPRRDREGAAAGIAATLFAVVYVGLLGAYVVALRRSPDGFRLVLTFGLMAVLHDVGAFFTGTAVGRHPLARAMSPKKTWAGWAGGTAVTIAVAAIAATRLDPPFTWPTALVLAALVSAAAPLGDLCESMLKRDIGAKDTGSFLPEHGGVLDVIDSVLFAAPVFFYAFRALAT
jgi:phosphatidate cytidylyltransferase